MSFIYKITNNVNGKLYIGKTSHSSIEERFKEHINDSHKSHCEKRPLYEAMRKYGVENFTIELIEEIQTDKEACIREIYWIEKLRTYIGYEDSNGYNATLGGDSRRLYDYKLISQKYLELQSVKQVCEYFNCDEKVVRQACYENNISIISGAEQSKIKNSKKILQIDKDTNEILCEYDSISDAFRALGKTKSGGISKVCNGNAEYYLGYKWQWK